MWNRWNLDIYIHAVICIYDHLKGQFASICDSLYYSLLYQIHWCPNIKSTVEVQIRTFCDIWLDGYNKSVAHTVESRDGTRVQEKFESTPNHTSSTSDAEMDQISHAEDNLYNTEFKTCIFMALFNIS